MAPAISLPILGLSRAPAGKRWADVEDCGTPTPWVDYALPDFNIKQDAACDTAQPTKWPQRPSQDMPVLLQSTYMFAQPCPAFADKMVNEMAGFQGPFHVTLAQTCPAYSEVSGSCATSQQQQQQNLSGYEPEPALQHIHEQMDMQAPHGWACNLAQGNTMAPQWQLGYALAPPHQSATLEDLSQWQSNASSDLEAPMPTHTEELVEVQQDFTQKPSQRHNAGSCRPCAWFWRKGGCQNGDDCGYCHLCPEGELKARKKNKIAAMRMGALTPVKSTQTNGGWGLRLDSLVQGKA